MTRSLLTYLPATALAAALVFVPPAHAEETTGPIAEATPTTVDPAHALLALPLVSDAEVLALAPEVAVHAEGGAAIRVGTPAPRYDAARFRPRRQRHAPARSSSGYGGAAQFHGGFLDPDGDADRGLLFGFRLGPKLNENVQIGGGLDWRYRSQSFTEVVGSGIGPGGEDIEIRRELSRSTSNWVPLQAHIELNAGNDLPVIPYFGLGGSYQWLHITGDDFATGEYFEATFGGFGWQVWGGAAFPLNPNTRLTAEVFVNDAELSRESIDASSGDTVKETISMDGVGMRFGVSWGLF